MVIDEGTKIILGQINSSLREIKDDQKETNHKIERVNKELKDELSGTVGKIRKKISELDKDKLSKEDFKPYKAFSHKANWLVWSLLLGGLITSIII